MLATLGCIGNRRQSRTPSSATRRWVHSKAAYGQAQCQPPLGPQSVQSRSYRRDSVPLQSLRSQTVDEENPEMIYKSRSRIRLLKSKIARWKATFITKETTASPLSTRYKFTCFSHKNSYVGTIYLQLRSSTRPCECLRNI